MTPKAPRRPTVWDRMARDKGASGGYDLAANVLVGWLMGWAAQRYLGAPSPWGLAGGVVLGSVSGFYQLFKTQSAPRSTRKPPDGGDGRG